MLRLLKCSVLLIPLFLVHACSNIPDKNWYQAVPEKTPFVIIPAEDATIYSVLQSEYIPFLDDITSSAIPLVSQVDSSASSSLTLKAVMLYPGTQSNLEPIWVTESKPGLVVNLQQIYYKKFTQNQYHFKGVTIHKLHIRERAVFAAELNDILLLSESSLGIEDVVRSYVGQQPALATDGFELKPGSIIMNTPALDKVATQLSKVSYRPYLKNGLKGTGPVLLDVSRMEGEEISGDIFSGTIPLTNDPASELVAALSHQNAPIELDRYISSNAAAFGIFRLEPRLAPPASLPDTTELDVQLMDDKVRYSKFAKSLGNPFAMVMYSESGFLSTGEHLFIREVTDSGALREELDALVNDGMAELSGGTYFIQSRILSELIGSGMSDIRDFYLDLTGDVVVISKRKGLAEIVASDRSRRRVIYYEQNYRDIKQDLPEEISGVFIGNSDFYSFIEPFLGPDNYGSIIASQFDMVSISTRLNEDGNSLGFSLRTYQTSRSDQPYQEKWLFPTGGSDLTGKPILTDIGGSSRDEVVFATENGSIYALAADGTVVLKLDTGSDTPVGSPVVYDWYATNQRVILIAAGNKIYGWDETGSSLPQFPFELNEQITSPLAVQDIDRNGLPEALVATANRQLHAFDGRGQNLTGWPLTTNSVIRTKPTIDYYEGAYSVMAFSENAIHAWFPDGVPRDGFPKFVNASLSGSPYLYQGRILAGAADGYLYAVGRNRLFADSLNIYSGTSQESGIEAVYVSNSALTGTPTVQNVRVRADEESETHSGDMIISMSANGSAFLLNSNGQLRFTKSMGQPSAQGFSPFITDINNDNRSDLIALASFGRLYAWTLLGGERIQPLPTTGMEYPIVENIDGDQYVELIAQTREGLRCWTIYGQSE
ncbi:hypothetical protein G3570_15640 [Balneolaceae bacterium YR4-1]|uniref:VCBS repeat-containing protein n=1 Tax=Halalkalibaculum roseum TaxID=2709311 RepID=A0A6M1SRN4_9BACT|nr:hypothetical protein [Halalkalibaculum roseum]NGP78081.1 hypothetical protein [Halalkalibaculum roseum]